MKTIGYYLKTPEVAHRRSIAAWNMRCALAGLRARAAVLRRLADLYDEVRCGRTLDVIARELRALADDLDAIPARLAQATEVADREAA